MRGETVYDAHPALRMFQLCEAMKWSHLPVAGGLYDQRPELLDAFLIIFSERGKYEEEEQRKRDREMGHNRPKPTSRSSGSRRGRR